MTILMVSYTYIYVSGVFRYFQSYIVYFTFLTFFYLLRHGGKQKCYQIKIENKEGLFPKIEYQDPREKKHGWLWAISLYTQAFAFSLIGNFLYWVDYRVLSPKSV